MDVFAGGGPGNALPVDAKTGLGSGMALLLDELAYGMVVAGADGQVLHANQAARHELGRRRVLALQGAALHARTADDGRVLLEALAKAIEGKRSLITLTAAEGPGLMVAVLPLRAEGGHPPRVAVMFARASVCDSLMLCFFARSHGLTATEETVLGVLCQGYSAPQVALQMKVAVSTIRSHVRSLCAKTRSSGVRELVNRVAVLPPVAPAFWQEPLH
ncbi:LuxR C-terminal-related transcriptional regulator [uncultured Ramlibacter sp.]|uniref:helix-turn-helix transcriptional regulator n=1 Tax=uncultured Ramlibacter sp. TaxID=260755 RepID=UPI0026109218|nr:LuxR C-terminal-related transcriptional regulator [uncultured Ramlibacter sp.]